MLGCFAAEDPKAAPHGLIEPTLRYLSGGLRAQLGGADCIQREQPQCVDLVTPGQQIPVLPVVQ